MPRSFLLAALTTILAGTAVAAGPASSPATAADPTAPDRLLGRWQSVRINDKAVPPDLRPTWTIEPGRVTVLDASGTRAAASRLSIDRTQDPPRLSMHVDGEDKPRVGRFRFVGDELHLTLTVNTGRPPASWEDGVLLVFRPAGP